MSTRDPVPGSGQLVNPLLFICGERPGITEARRGIAFVGDAGEELWARLWDICGIERDECWVTNLVKTFSRDPPSPEEIARDSRELRIELVRIRPTLIVTIGYHAARWFLPQFENVNGDYFHGLPFPFRYGVVERRASVVVPVVHSSAALRQPSLYQNQFTRDVASVARMVRAVRAGSPLLHRARRQALYQVGLATTISDARGGILGLDTEGSIDPPWDAECISLSARDGQASCVETFESVSAIPHVQAAIDAASRIAIHHAKHDKKTLARLGLRIPWRKIDDTLVMAKLLDLPGALKVLAYRELGWAMTDYEDLVQPLDDALVRATLGEAYETWKGKVDRYKRRYVEMGKVYNRRRDRRAAHGRRGTTARGGGARGVQAAAEKQAKAQAIVEAIGPPPFPPRALTSIQGILAKGGQDTLRVRWTKSTFSPHVPLPPAPTWKDAPQPARVEYAMTDAGAHRTLRDRLWRRVVKRRLERVYRVDMGRLPMLCRMEQIGMAVDEREMGRLSLKFQREHRNTCWAINDLAGFDVNPHSGEQVSDVLFHELHITPTRETKSGKHFTTADKYLKARRNEHAIIPLILTARQLNKYIGTYTEKLPTLLHEGRYFPSFTQAKTGREAEEIILLIPKHDPLAKSEGRENRAKAIRNCFHATDGNVLVSVDLSQIELRVMAHESQDEELLKAFRSGVDLHSKVAHELLGAPKRREDQDESKHRLPIKTFHFSIINGTTEYGLLDQLHEQGLLDWTLDTVTDLLDEWFRLHKGVKRYWDAQIEKAKARGYVEDLFGRRSYLYGLSSTDERIVRATERQCLFPVQSGADGISKVWNAAIWKHVIVKRRRERERYCEPWIRVHDDTTLEVDRRIVKATAREMLGLVPDLLTVPTEAKAEKGERWGELVEMEIAS